MSEQEAEHRFPCVECGSDLRFNPSRGALTCDYCGAEAPLEPLLSLEDSREELSYSAAISAEIPESEIEVTRIVKCESCGAQVELGGQDHAAECPFCASPIVVGTGTNRHLKPRAVLPFHVAEDTARDSVGAWLGRLWFAPNGLKTYARKGRRLQGIYVPYWTYDSETDSRYTGERGDHYYVTVTVAMHLPDAGDNPGPRRGPVIHAMRGQRADFQKGRACIQHPGHTVARQHLAARKMARAGLLTATASRQRGGFGDGAKQGKVLVLLAWGLVVGHGRLRCWQGVVTAPDT